MTVIWYADALEMEIALPRTTAHVIKDIRNQIVCLQVSEISPIIGITNLDCSSLNSCNGHGVCAAPDYCVCNPGYNGTSCEIQE